MTSAMNTDVDLRDLAIDRTGAEAQSVRSRRHLLTRFVLPAALVAGFAWLIAWAAWDLVFPPQPVRVVPVFSTRAEVRQEGTPLFKAAGWIEPRPTPVRVAALAPGVVEQLLVVEDQPVQAGEPIAVMIKDDAKLQYERALAELELRQAELDEAKAALTAAQTRLEQPVHLEAALGEAEAALARVETQLTNLPFELRRAEADQMAMRNDYQGKLAAQAVVAGVEIDYAKGKFDAAEALVDELQGRSKSLEAERAALVQRRDALKRQLELLADEIKAKDAAAAMVRAASARATQAQVAVAEAKLQLDRMTVVSPIDGRVFRLIAHPGARVSSGSAMTQMVGHDGSTVVTLYRPDMLQVRVDVRFEDIPNVSLDQPVEIDNPALSTPLTGSVLFISSEADIQKNTLEVKVAIPDPPPVFKPEMLVDVTFLAPRPTERTSEPIEELKLFLPHALLRQGEEGEFVWLADRSAGVARRVLVNTGSRRRDGLVEITDGLTVASRVISTGTDGLEEGDRIDVVGEDPALATASMDRPTDRSRVLNRLPAGDDD